MYMIPIHKSRFKSAYAVRRLGFGVPSLGGFRTLPELTILSPADPGETRECVQWLADNPRPSYLRLGKAGEPVLHERRGLTQGTLKILAGRSDCALVTTGSILKVALEAARKLAGEGIPVSVYSCPWLQPLTAEWFRPLTHYRRLVVVEEYLVAGGLASLLREHLANGPEILSLSPSAAVLNQVGFQEFLRRLAGIDAEAVRATLRRIF